MNRLSDNHSDIHNSHVIVCFIINVKKQVENEKALSLIEVRFVLVSQLFKGPQVFSRSLQSVEPVQRPGKKKMCL